jgi:hypothetical protein
MGQIFSAPMEAITTASEVADYGAKVGGVGLTGLAGEQHFTPAEIARLWGLSQTKVRRLFQAEPGVLRLGEGSRRAGRRLKRGYFTLRIPETIALRVHRRLSATGKRQ